MKTHISNGTLPPFVLSWNRLDEQGLLTGDAYLTWEDVEAVMPDVLNVFLSVASTKKERAEMLAGRFSIRKRDPT